MISLLVPVFAGQDSSAEDAVKAEGFIIKLVSPASQVADVSAGVITDSVTCIIVRRLRQGVDA